jgi:hypothetical protein
MKNIKTILLIVLVSVTCLSWLHFTRKVPAGSSEDVNKFVLDLIEVIKGGMIEDLNAVVLDAVPNQHAVDRFFVGYSMKLRSWEVREVGYARSRWGGLVIGLLDSMEASKSDDYVVWFHWSDVAEGEGRIKLNQYVVVTKNERGEFRVRIK